LLPSALREGTLELVRSAGFNRLSFGVQSTNDRTLERFHRDYASPSFVGDIVAKGFALGFDEINLDLIWGLRGDAANQFERSLLDTLARRPTTVTIHHIVPTTTNRPFLGTAEEIESHTRFRQLDRELGPLLEREAPGYVWVYRSDCWALVEERFLASGVFGPWYYSDNERLHIDMLGLGRFAHSRILGGVQYEDLPMSLQRFDPEAPSFSVFMSNAIIDGGMDLLAGLIGDRVVDLEEISARYEMASTEALSELLERLEAEGVVAREGASRWRFLPDEHIFLQHLMPIVGLIEEQAYATNPTPASEDDVRSGLRVQVGNSVVQVRVQRTRAREKYYAEVGPFGLSYAVVSREQPARHLIEGFMAEAVRIIEATLTSQESPSSELVSAALHRELCGPAASAGIPR
jgi:hypothetical protein